MAKTGKRKTKETSQLRERREEISQYAVRRRADRLVPIISRFPEKLAAELALRDESCWIFGRLYLVGAITRDQYVASEKLSKAISNYRRLLNRYSLTKISNFDKVGSFPKKSGVSGERLTPGVEKAFQKAFYEYSRRIEVLHECGENVEKAVMYTMDSEFISDIMLIREGLEALSTKC